MLNCPTRRVKNVRFQKSKGNLSMLQNLRLKNAKKTNKHLGGLVPCEGLSLLDIETYFLLEQLSLKILRFQS
jgi:hypothetical protein